MALLCPARATRAYPLKRDYVTSSVPVQSASTNMSLGQSSTMAISNASGDQAQDTKSALLRLPLELRIYIYEYALTLRPLANPAGQAVVQTLPGPYDPTKTIKVSKNAVSLLLTSHQIYEEAYDVYVQQNMFLIRQEPYSLSEVSFLAKYATRIRNVAVELYFEDLVWVAPLGSIQDWTWDDEFGPINPGPRYYVPGLKAMKALKAALLPLKRLKSLHILIKGWSNESNVMPFRFTRSRNPSDKWCLKESAVCINDTKDKWIAQVMKDKEDDELEPVQVTLQIDAPFTNREHRVLGAVWGVNYRCVKTVSWV